MKERPILFSGPMVRAILAGTKIQTRRVVKPQPEWVNESGVLSFKRRVGLANALCPYGQTGQKLWVRETCRADELPDGLDGVRYMADDHFEPIKNTEGAADQWVAMHHYRGGNGGGLIGPTVPPIHMPRWASRITLEVTGVRVERLQDISDDDIKAEGIVDDPKVVSGEEEGSMLTLAGKRIAFEALWEQINGPGSWAAKPWVWVIEFKRVKGGAA